MARKNYYDILEVSPDADSAEIKHAYRRQARRFHPDVSSEPESETRFKEVQEAYEVLKDDDKRAVYDQFGLNGNDGFQMPPDFDPAFEFRAGHSGSGVDLNDLLREIFDSSFDPSAASQKRTVEIPIQIDLEDAVDGATRRIQLRLPHEPRPRTIDVVIPSGVRAGQHIRLPGISSAENAATDILLRVEFKPHRIFRIDGSDVTLPLGLAPWEAALGTQVTVPGLGGALTVTVPPGTQSGQRLRLRSRGLPAAGHNNRGDMFVEIKIVTPPADTAARKTLYQQMAEEMPFDPRPELSAATT